MRCRQNPSYHCPVINRIDFIAGILVGIGIGSMIILCWFVL